jgi:DNA-binding transcriptional LysR family regulator
MDIWQLKIFQNVIELEGFSKAAEAVHLTQPTVSSHIRDLENHFGCKLVDRMGKKALPTGAGKLLYSYAQQITRLTREAEEAMARFLGVVSGRLTVGGSTIPGGYILPRLIGDFKKKFPGVNISIEVGDTQQIMEAIMESHLDFGVVGARLNQPGILQEPLFADEMRLVIPPHHKWSSKSSVTLKTLLKEPFIIREKGSGTRKSLENSLATHDLGLGDFSIAAELGSTTAVIQGIKSGIGVSVLSAIAVADEIRTGILKSLSISGLNLKRHFYLTYHKNHTQSPICMAFIDFLRSLGEIKTQY